MTTMTLDTVHEQHAEHAPVSLARVTGIELRKMFDTRSGFWLMASIVIAGLLATAATIAFAPDAELTYYTFAKAIGFPMTVILPIIAVLAITGEWSQRSGLTTFTLVPHRHRVVAAKIVASVVVGVTSMVFALVVGVAGNIVGTSLAGTDLVWDVSFVHGLDIMLGSLLGLLTGTMLGLVFRSSPVALVTYFVYALVLPNLFALLASTQDWFRHLQPWVDLSYTQAALFEGTLTGEQWAQLAVNATVWLVLPGLAGLAMVMRSEVK